MRVWIVLYGGIGIKYNAWFGSSRSVHMEYRIRAGHSEEWDL